MEEADLTALLARVRAGELPVDDAVAELRRLPFADLGFARVDHHRALRQSRAEVVFGPGKTAPQCVAIVGELLRGGSGPVLLTRASDEQVDAVLTAHPAGVVRAGVVAWRPVTEPDPARVLVVTAGTGDLPVAEECVVVLETHGLRPDRLDDVGVAGLHRLLAALDLVTGADLVVVVAGMEGALASVVGGLTAAPVVAVPTSVGYGASLAGVTALLGMLASCASGITVVGIDNGFGAACAVLRTLDLVRRPTPSAATGPDAGNVR